MGTVILRVVHRSLFLTAFLVAGWLAMSASAGAALSAPSNSLLLSCDPDTDPYCHDIPYATGCDVKPCDSQTQICCLP